MSILKGFPPSKQVSPTVKITDKDLANPACHSSDTCLNLNNPYALPLENWKKELKKELEWSQAKENWKIKNPIEDKDLDFIEKFLAENEHE